MTATGERLAASNRLRLLDLIARTRQEARQLYPTEFDIDGDVATAHFADAVSDLWVALIHEELSY